MNLKTLAKKAKGLPELDFEWAGVEQFHPEVFDKQVTDLPSVIGYLRELRDRMAKQSLMLHDLTAAYMQLKDIILEAEIE